MRFGSQSNMAIMVVVMGLLGLAACAPAAPVRTTPVATVNSEPTRYLIGPGDVLEISVWHNAELSTKAPVRPDGRISTPLVPDVMAAGRTPEDLGHELEGRLKKFVADPIVTVIVSNFVGPYDQQIRIVGEAATPKALPYQAHMTVLDAMIAAGGLTPYASGNRAKVVRRIDGKDVETTVRLTDLLKGGDLSANMELRPGDIIIIPQSFF
jgi:polysaccharide export outer membrane protein